MAGAPMRPCAFIGATAQSEIAAAQAGDIKKRFFIETSQVFVMEASSGPVPDLASTAQQCCPIPTNRNQFLAFQRLMLYLLGPAQHGPDKDQVGSGRRMSTHLRKPGERSRLRFEVHPVRGPSGLGRILKT